MSFLGKIFLIFTIYFYQTSGLGQEIPRSPCPDIFKYLQEASGDIYGLITIPHPGGSTLNLGINASMQGYYTDSNTVVLKLYLLTPNQELIQKRVKFLTYSVEFPFQHTIPKITNIDLNKRKYCTGPPEKMVPGSAGVTSLWFGHNTMIK